VFKYNVASDPTSTYAHAPCYLPSIYIVRSSDTRWSPSVGYSGFGLRILWCSWSGNHQENSLTKFGYLSLKEGSLFCFVVMRSMMLQIMFLVSPGSSRPKGVHRLGSMTFGVVVQKFLNIEWFLHWKLN